MNPPASSLTLRLPEETFSRRAAHLSWALFDVDGVLTDGRLIYGPSGQVWKAFDVKDGHGLKLLQQAGIRTGWLTGRDDEAVHHRAVELGIDLLLTGQADKDKAFTAFLAGNEVRENQVAFVGDDLPDLPVLRRCGLSFAPADAVEKVRQEVHVILGSAGGRGAVRQMAEMILAERNHPE